MNRLIEPPPTRFEGLHFDDPFKEWLNKHNKREQATKDITKLSNEVFDYRNDLFPVRSVPVPDRPGRVTLDQEFFTIEYSGKRLKEYLNNYFSEESYSRTEKISLGAHDLAEFFMFALHELLVDGIFINAIEWGEKKIGTKKYILPISFNGMNPSTVKIKKTQQGYSVKQSFSPFAKFINTFYTYKNAFFENDEVLIFKHPFYPSSPVGISLKLLKDLKAGMTFSLLSGEALNNPTYKSMQFEKTRGKSSTSFWRKQKIARVKVRRIFNQNLGGSGINLTTYYQIYAYKEYKKTLNDLREYLMAEFNKQVIERIRTKNNIKRPILMRYKGFISNDQIEELFKKFQEGKITGQEFIENTKDDLGI